MSETRDTLSQQQQDTHAARGMVLDALIFLARAKVVLAGLQEYQFQQESGANLSREDLLDTVRRSIQRALLGPVRPGREHGIGPAGEGEDPPLTVEQHRP